MPNYSPSTSVDRQKISLIAIGPLASGQLYITELLLIILT